MPRKERPADREQRLKQDLADVKRALKQAQAERREEERTARNRRRFLVGLMADEHGLLVWDDQTLAGLFQTLALLRETPNPIAVLESLLAAPHWLDAGVAHGTAQAAPGVPLAGH